MKNRLLLILAILSLSSCTGNIDKKKTSPAELLPYHQPSNYICQKVDDVLIDGKLSESEWSNIEWTDLFKDIQGDEFPKPKYNTRVKIAWNDDYLFIAAEIEEPHVWANITKRDEVIFYDNDFEVFIDPDGDNHHYYELEVNAFETAWDLLLTMPYRDFGYAIDSWDINGLKVGVSVQGTINDPSDIDQGWTVEIAIPFMVLEECISKDGKPSVGDLWRINFSRVEWKTEVKDGKYVKQLNPETGKHYPEDNWVWSPQYHVNMHMPEYWGYLKFANGTDKQNWELPEDEKTKWYLRNVYYLQKAFLGDNKRYANDLAELRWPKTSQGEDIPTPEFQKYWKGFNAALPALDGSGFWLINHNGLIKKIKKLQ